MLTMPFIHPLIHSFIPSNPQHIGLVSELLCNLYAPSIVGSMSEWIWQVVGSGHAERKQNEQPVVLAQAFIPKPSVRKMSWMLANSLMHLLLHWELFLCGLQVFAGTAGVRTLGLG